MLLPLPDSLIYGEILQTDIKVDPKLGVLQAKRGLANKDYEDWTLYISLFTYRK